MRVTGDAEDCRRLARHLQRAAAAVEHGAAQVRAARQGVPSWHGEAVESWARAALVHADAGLRLAERLGRVSAVLATHADELEVLQARVRRLHELAATGPLTIEQDATIAPVVLPVAMPRTADELLQHVWAPRLESLRAELLREVRRLQQDELATHERSRRALQALVAGDPGGTSSSAWWGAPPVLVEGAVGALGRSTSDAVRRGATRAGRAAPVLGPVAGVVVDLHEGRPLVDAVAKQTAVGVIGGVAATAAGGVAVVAAAPGIVAVGVPLAVAVALGAGAGVVYDRVVRDGPDPDRRTRTPPAVTRGRRPRPVGPPPAPQTRPATPAPRLGGPLAGDSPRGPVVPSAPPPTPCVPRARPAQGGRVRPARP